MSIARREKLDLSRSLASRSVKKARRSRSYLPRPPSAVFRFLRSFRIVIIDTRARASERPSIRLSGRRITVVSRPSTSCHPCTLHLAPTRPPFIPQSRIDISVRKAIERSCQSFVNSLCKFSTDKNASKNKLDSSRVNNITWNDQGSRRHISRCVTHRVRHYIFDTDQIFSKIRFSLNRFFFSRVVRQPWNCTSAQTAKWISSSE